MAEENKSVLDVFSFLKSEFSKEQTSNFSLLKKVPDTSVFKFLDYFEKLHSVEQSELVEAIAYRSLQFFFSKDEIETSLPQASDAAYQRYLNALCFMAADRYTDARSLRLLATMSKSEELWYLLPKPPEEFLRYAASIGSVKAAEMRKLIKSAFAQLFGARITNLGGGVWLYEGSFEKSDVEVAIDFGGHYQLRYEVTIRSHSRPIMFKRLRYESLLGAGHGDWNFLTEENLSPSLELLCEFVTYLAKLPERLPASYSHNEIDSQ